MFFEQGSTSSTAITSVSSTNNAQSTSSSTIPTTAALTTSTERGATSTRDGNSVVTEVSTVSGGGTVVVVKTTAKSTQTAASDNASSSSSDGGKIGGIVGGVVGGLALLTAAVLLFFLWRRRRSRTGHGYFLCFGTRPNRNNKDFDVNWPTFDPALGSSAVGGTVGSRSGNYGNNGAYGGGTLPEVDENGDGYSPEDEMMRETGQGSYNNYYGAASAVAAGTAPSAYSSHPTHGGAHSASYKGRSEEGHHRMGWGGIAPTASEDAVPTYDHLDPPEVRQARAREQAEAQAQAMAAYSNSNSSPPPLQQNQPAAPPYYTSSSPPLSSQRPLSDHRLSTGTTQALAANQYFDDPDAGTLPPQTDQQRALHLHNPDGAY